MSDSRDRFLDYGSVSNVFESLGVDRVYVDVRHAVVGDRDPLEDSLHDLPLRLGRQFLDGLGKSADKIERLDWRRGGADIGAGTGFITQGLINASVRVIAVDQSQSMLDELLQKFAASNLVESRLGRGDANPIPDRTVDYAFANMYLHHVEDPPGAINEMARILKPGGTLVITDLDKHDVEFLRTGHHDYWLGFRRSDLKRWLKLGGFQQIDVISTNEYCSSTSSQGPLTANIGIFLAAGHLGQPRGPW